jgi:drug/metabolite transporter (DMT)-like permease
VKDGYFLVFPCLVGAGAAIGHRARLRFWPVIIVFFGLAAAATVYFVNRDSTPALTVVAISYAGVLVTAAFRRDPTHLTTD